MHHAEGMATNGARKEACVYHIASGKYLSNAAANIIYLFAFETHTARQVNRLITDMSCDRLRRLRFRPNGILADRRKDRSGINVALLESFSDRKSVV